MTISINIMLLPNTLPHHVPIDWWIFTSPTEVGTLTQLPCQRSGLRRPRLTMRTSLTYRCGVSMVSSLALSLVHFGAFQIII